MLDAVSSLSCAIISSLKQGLIRRNSFTVSVRRDVFNFLFNGCGTRVFRKPGKMYSKNDFCNYFKDFMYTSVNNGCVRVVFPIYMYSHTKFVKLDNKSNYFNEIVCIHLFKERF